MTVFKLSLLNDDLTPTWTRTIPAQEGLFVSNVIEKDLYHYVPVALSAFIPIRVHTYKHFAVDLFIPLTARIHQTFKTEKLALVIILAYLGGLFLDLVTFPIRLLLAFPRLIVTWKREPHPLQTFLFHRHRIVVEEKVIVRLEKITFTYLRGTSVRVDKESIARTVYFTDSHCAVFYRSVSQTSWTERLPQMTDYPSLRLTYIQV